jgi:hypothetical protein
VIVDVIAKKHCKDEGFQVGKSSREIEMRPPDKGGKRLPSAACCLSAANQFQNDRMRIRHFLRWGGESGSWLKASWGV